MLKKLSIVSKFNNINIGQKLLLSYVLVVFLPVLLVGFILIYNMRQMAVDRAVHEAVVNVDRVYVRLNEVLKIPMGLSYKAHIDENLVDLLSKSYEGPNDMIEAYGRYNEFDTFLSLYGSELKNIKFYTYNQTILDSGRFIKITPELYNTNWFKRVKEADGKICWQYLYDELKNGSYFSLTTVVKAIQGSNIGVLIISINDDYLYNILKNEPYETFFCDELGYVVASREREIIGKNIKDTKISVIDGMEDGIWDIENGGKPSKAIVKTFSPSVGNGRFKIVSIVPVSVIEAQTSRIAFLGIFIMISSLILALILIIIFTNAISKRVKKVSRDMHTVATGNFDFIPTVDGDDEIGQLSTDLGIMVKSIKALVHEVYEVNLQKNKLALKQREIKLQMLANQINPHFLFNALETIRMKAHCSGEDEIAEVVQLLGKIMRRNLEVGNELVTLEWEIDMVKSYLEIQKFRYGDKIGYEINIDSEIKNYMILPLTIQPIVENSIVHGIECKQDGGLVKIDITRNSGFVRIAVEDDGVGMSRDKLQEVRQSLVEDDDVQGRRIGLKNVYERIKLFYGEGYGLTIDSMEHEGTSIEIILPLEGMVEC